MLLRSTVEQIMPTRKDEARLSKKAREIAFRGMYINPLGRSIWLNEGIIHQPKYTTQYKQWRSYHDVKQREYSIQERDLFDEISKHSTQERACRASNIARFIKVSSALLLTAAGIHFGVKDGIIPADPFSTGQPESYQTINDCSTSVDGSEPLIPINESQINEAQASGQVVCQIDGYDYAFSPRV